MGTPEQYSQAQYTWDKRTPAKAWTYYTSSKVYPTELNSAETSKATDQGHYSSDAKCPQYEKKNTSGDSPQVEGNGGISEGDNKSPVLNNDELEVVEDDQEYSLSDFGGLQYESEREDNLSPIKDNTNSLLFGGMRIAPFKELLEELVHAHSMAIQPGRNLRHAWLYDAKCRAFGEFMALALFDSGCTTDSITLELVYVCKANQINLKEPVGLPLGTKGSHMHINYGASATLQVGKLC
ncbi:hypothetical protein NUW54_g220 [Trametes sanguinea]|uniref:Uncharacterized protein n=2 Tax=Trametes sanguinea TaxID=158606 RepID=A0ACC1QA18_9APHY|nr:hypothetical protein NUW54_g844 [Trametes sanguinea]KAJ3018918.1 hypothetical protein NUW54_g220 [Trametes sanguinea]